MSVFIADHPETWTDQPKDPMAPDTMPPLAPPPLILPMGIDKVQCRIACNALLYAFDWKFALGAISKESWNRIYNTLRDASNGVGGSPGGLIQSSGVFGHDTPKLKIKFQQLQDDSDFGVPVSRLQADAARQFIASGFLWGKTRETPEFWSYVHYRLVDFAGKAQLP